MSVYRVWVSVEEETDDEEYTDHSFDLDGASVATFDTLDAAVDFANWLQKTGQLDSHRWVKPDQGRRCRRCGLAPNAHNHRTFA